MSEERKEYSVIGTVSIGTDEYRDLIERCSDLEHELQSVRSEKSDYYWKNRELEDKVKEMEKDIEQYKCFINDGHQDTFKLWKLEQMEDSEE